MAVGDQIQTVVGMESLFVAVSVSSMLNSSVEIPGSDVLMLLLERTVVVGG